MKLIASLFLITTLCVLTCAAASIGIVKSTGDFRVGGSTIRGNSNVFEGDVIETTSARSTVQLGQVEVTLLPDSRAKVFQNRTVIEKGSGLVRDGENHIIEAGTLQIAASGKESVVQVDMNPKTVTVSTRGGAATVRNAAGVLVASLRPETAVAFTPQAAGATSVKMAGTLEAKDGKYFLTDRTTQVRAELQGIKNVTACQSKDVQITGTTVPGTAAAGASQIVKVIKMESSNKSCGAAAVAAGVATGSGVITGTAGVANGISGATIAVIAGVAAAGTVGGLAAAGTIGGSSSSSNP